MEYYCVMVMSGEEKAFKEDAEKKASELFPSAKFYSFQRKLCTNQGKYFDAALFPGYAFFSVEKLDAEFMLFLHKVKGFCRILYDNHNPVKIRGTALDELLLFIHNGEYWGISKVQFLPGKRIKAVEGPLMGLEGKIVAVNKKKKRITVQSELTEDGKKFDLLYEDVVLVD
ncbi:MAG: KOW motif-containing protein [Treponema sp.]|nr:KOW motif-containing protein [Treponema sp.]